MYTCKSMYKVYVYTKQLLIQTNKLCCTFISKQYLRSSPTITASK